MTNHNRDYYSLAPWGKTQSIIWNQSVTAGPIYDYWWAKVLKKMFAIPPGTTGHWAFLLPNNHILIAPKKTRSSLEGKSVKWHAKFLWFGVQSHSSFEKQSLKVNIPTREGSMEEVTLIPTIAFHSRRHPWWHSRRSGMHSWRSGITWPPHSLLTVRNAIGNALLNEKQWSGSK